MLSIVDYKMGNIKSVRNALSFLGIQSNVVTTKTEIMECSKLVLPGVGSYKQAMENIHSLGLFNAIRDAVQEKQVPLLGICLGMQLLSDFGEEDGYSDGLGLVPGRVIRLKANDSSYKIPHIGFNSVYKKQNNCDLFLDQENPADFYFVHSYHFVVDNDEHCTSYCIHGEKFAASVQNGNVFGVQFHPEKSQSNGLKLLKKFAEWGTNA